MADQTQRLEVATVRAEVGSSILYRFSNDAVDAAVIPTESGNITNLKKVILDIQTEGAEKISFATTIYPTTAAGIAATASGAIFLVRSNDADEIYAVYSNNSGTAVDTGKRALASSAITAATDSATAAAVAAQTAADTATARVAGFHSPSAIDPTTRDDGTALQVGDTYFNTSTQANMVYSSTGWVPQALSAAYINDNAGASRVGTSGGSNVQSSLDAINSSITTAITGSAAKLTTPRSISVTGDASYSTTFDGSANVTGMLTLADTGVTPGTGVRVTVDSKGRVTAVQTSALAVANGGTGATSAASARSNLSAAASGANSDITSISGLTAALPINQGGTGGNTALLAGSALGASAVGTNTTQLAQAAMVQLEIANKRTWTSYTPTITAGVGSFTSASATGRYMTAFGICHLEVIITVTTKGTGTFPNFTLPVAALSGDSGHIFPFRESKSGKSGSAVILGNLTTCTTILYDSSDSAPADASVLFIRGFYPVA